MLAPIIRDGRVQPGERWREHEFAETDYRYGSGPLRLRIVYVEWTHHVTREDDRWILVEGIVIDPDGREGERRSVLIRIGCLPGPPPARKRPRLRGWQPART
jgi:hypothetical protein